jgi:hypothetical protein
VRVAAGLTAAPGTGGLPHVCAGLQVADGDDLFPRPDPDGEGVGSMVQDSMGAVVGLLEGGMTLLRCSQMKGAWRRSVGSSSGNRRLECCLLEREEAGASKGFLTNFYKYQQKNSFHAKTHLAKQLEFQKLPQLGKDQFLPSVACGVQGVLRVTPQPKLPQWRGHAAHP